MKLLCGVVLLCLSAFWAVFWLSDPLLSYYADYQVVSVLVAGLALIPAFWATSILDGALRAPLAPAAAAKRLVAHSVRDPCIEAKTKSDDHSESLTPDERGPVVTVLGDLPEVSVADELAASKSATPAAA